MADNLTEEQRKRNMRAIRSQRTNIEQIVAAELWNRGIRYRSNVATLYGKPDFAIQKYRVVIFIDSCFGHGCDIHCQLPREYREYWLRKIERNKRRDVEVTE